MQQVLIQKLHQYIADNHLDLLIALQGEGRVSSYLIEKVEAIDPLLNELLAAGTPAYIVEERCMEELSRDLRPSKYHYLVLVLEEELERDYYRLKKNGLLTYEVTNLIKVCTPVFEAFDFREENESDRHLRYAIVGAVKEYFEKSSEKENVRYGLSSITKIKL